MKLKVLAVNTLLVIFVLISCTTTNDVKMKNAITVPYPQVINTINLELTKENIEVIGEYNITKTEIETEELEQNLKRDNNIGIAIMNDMEISNLNIATMSSKEYLFRVCMYELYKQFPDADYYLYPIIEYSREKMINDEKNKILNSITIKGKAIRIKL